MIIQYPKKNIYKNNSFEKKKYTNLKKIPLNIQNKHKKIKKRNQYPL